MPKRSTRSREEPAEAADEKAAKKRKADAPKKAEAAGALEAVNKAPEAVGTVYVIGSGDCGQLGLGEDVPERLRPGAVPLPDDKKACVATAGGMHTLCLAEGGTLYSWGVNDEAALGRPAGGEPWAQFKGTMQASDVPGPVDMPDGAKRLMAVSAGDSHSAGVDEEGGVYAWGTFRDDAGVMGFSPEHRFALRPQLVWQPSGAAEQVLEIHSGCDHVAARCASGDVLTWGSGKQGQLGRVGVRMSDRGHTMLETFTRPARMHLPFSLRSKPASIACGWYSTFAILRDGSVYACGLNNYGQLGVGTAMAVYAPKKVKALAGQRVRQIASGAHHTLALCDDGSLHAFGRPTYGRLGAAGVATNSDEPVREAQQLEVADLDGKVQGVAAGDSVSGCFSEQMCGLFLCGSNNTGMLAKGDDDDDETQMARVKRTKAFNEVKVTQLSFGGQHVVMLTVPAQEAAS